MTFLLMSFAIASLPTVAVTTFALLSVLSVLAIVRAAAVMALAVMSTLAGLVCTAVRLSARGMSTATETAVTTATAMSGSTDGLEGV